MKDGALPDQHLQPGTSNSAERKLGLDDLPTEIIELICPLILRTRASRPERQAWHRLHKFPLDGRPCAQSIANLVAASRRYRDIALPFLYSRWACHSNKMGRPIDFVRTLCDNPALGLLVVEVVFQSGPTDIGDTPSLTSEEDGIFHDTALRLLPSLYPLDPIDKGDYDIRPWVNRQLLPLIFLLAPNLKRLSICVTDEDLGAITGSDKHQLPPLLTSVVHIEIFNLGSVWDSSYRIATIPRGEGSTIIRPLILISPALKTLTIRNKCLLGRKPEFKFTVDFLIELQLGDVLVSGRSLKWILRACKALEVFSVHSFPYPED
ncbi:hypothetical protein B0J13DRAFT_621759 [Dactylonectria estremocensis]|uniref:Uncharacterized protein n=1 Tax=Dactylonectria estremocensis TaxID=1079267 RepID=A0A9P9ETT9_9HYPO|nr:hypothetical protein B0J13DRAFT_621759 [Dactylonectria estremocensis]